MASKTPTIEINQNADQFITLQFKPDGVTPLNLYGCTFRADIKRNFWDTEVLHSLNSDDETIIVVGDVEDGTLSMIFNAFTIPNGKYVFDLIQFKSPYRALMLSGELNVYQGITQ